MELLFKIASANDSPQLLHGGQDGHTQTRQMRTPKHLNHGHSQTRRTRTPTHLNPSTFPLVHTTPQVQSVSPAAMVLTLTDAKKRHIKRVSLVILLLLYHNSLRDRSYLYRQLLVQANEAPWRRLFLHGDSTSFLHMTGLSPKAFRSLLDYLFDLDFIACHRRRGRPHSLPPDGYLGLFLFYLGSTISYKHL